MKRILFIIFLLPLYCYSQHELKQTNLLEGKLLIHTPQELSPMSDELWKIKYRKQNKPILILSDENAEINLIIDTTRQTIKESQLDEFKAYQIKQMQKQRPDMKLLSDGVKIINGKKIAFFKFMVDAVDQKVFNYFFLPIVNGKLVMCSFNCTEKLQPSWEETADKIVESIQIK